ncbi:hypothetical protein I862_00620 [endosymbiont of Acanthamoeba sp. UWC8]|uniref:hypothetical protein n=1 Tax=endosymbiont of Acanthamoeba sp. UWC8 TaxID=86106 RepID=UPI0004D1E73F|nr:hypothetical protein [endosymbiont of Acanthamoeba sp. UWC8]AIF80689.1 hypothetical protein I862_00620 [endosymbiont of Acanthamoeba sp. UWC8]
MLERIFKKHNNIHVSIGEEGIAVAYFIGNQIARKLFIRSTSDADTIELRKILLGDEEASLHLYIDVLDQTYIQRTLPAISVFNINKLAEQRLEKETIKTHLKSFLQVGRTEVGRNDWIYMFISTAFEPPISTWVKFFEEYRNIIQGIHFLPVELSTVVKKLRKNQVNSTNKLLKFKKLFSLFKNKENSGISTWEVLLTLNKSGGFRQVVFQNGRVIFTRLLNSLIDPNPVVIAGAIEQEIINSIEYLRRLSTKEKVEIYINILISNEIKKNIRRNKFNAKEVNIYTPYEASNILKIPPDITTENDRFCDPLILSLMHLDKKRVITVHTEETKKVYIYTKLFNYFLTLLKLAVPISIIFSLIAVFDAFTLSTEMKNFQFNESKLLANLDSKTNFKAKEQKKLGSDVNAQEVEEIVELYEQYKQYNTNPVEILQQLGEIRPDLAKVSRINISYQAPNLKYTPQSNNSYEKSLITKFSFIGRFTVTFQNYGSTYDELKNNYNDYAAGLTQVFNNYSVKVSSLPESFSFEDFKKALTLQIVIQTPTQDNGQLK